MSDYDADSLVICFDERPCFLIGDTVAGLEMEAGKPKKENYAYTKHGSAAVLAIISPFFTSILTQKKPLFWHINFNLFSLPKPRSQ